MVLTEWLSTPVQVELQSYLGICTLPPPQVTEQTVQSEYFHSNSGSLVAFDWGRVYSMLMPGFSDWNNS